AEGTCLIADVDRTRLAKRVRDRYLDEIAPNLDAAIDRALAGAAEKKARSIGAVANAVDLLERLLARKVTPDALTDQTSAHDPLYGYVPVGHTLRTAAALRRRDPQRYERLS